MIVLKAPNSKANARWVAVLLGAVATVFIFLGLVGGLVGTTASESFSLSDARNIRGGMYLHRIDLDRWPAPPFFVRDDARHGTSGSSTRLFLDDREILKRRVSTSILERNAEPGFLHTGVQNLYFAPGPDIPEEAVLRVEYLVLLDREAWIALVAAGSLLLIAAIGFLTGLAILYDAVLLTLAVATITAAWLHLSGLRYEHDLNSFEPRHLEPNGFLVRLPRPWPLEYHPTDRVGLDINARLHVNGVPAGSPLGLSAEIAGTGNGIHVLAAGGAFYYSVPGNVDPLSVDLSVKANAFLPWRLLALSGGCLALVLVAGLGGGVTPALAMLLRHRPVGAAIVIPVAGLTTIGWYLGWLVWVDPLHMYSPPQERDWFARDEAWRMAGLVRSYPYRGIILGTSVSQNFYMEEASRTFGRPVLNATMAGARPREQAYIARLSLARPETDLVVWELHANAFVRPPAEIRSEHFPIHLFDRDPLNDLEYMLSLQAWLDADAKLRAHDADTTERLDPINKWGESSEFGPKLVGKVYCDRRHRSAGRLDEEALRQNIRENVVPVALARPHVRFIMFLPPYSALFHLDKGGRTLGMERFAEIVLEETVSLPNLEVHDFLRLGDVISDPAKYRDDLHFHPSINSRVLRLLAQGQFRVRLDDIGAHRSELSQVLAEATESFTAMMDPFCENG